MYTLEEIIQKIKTGNVNRVRIAVADIDGILRGKIIHKDKLLNLVEKELGFCDVVFGWDCSDVCYDNVEVTGWHTAYPDAKATLDFNTYREIPWNNQLPFFLADFSRDPKMAVAACSRSLLKRIIQKANGMGFSPVFSQEFEWFNFLGTSNELAESDFRDLKPISSGMFGYSSLRPSQYQAYFNELFDLLEQFDVQLEGMHTETGPGVYEAAIKYDKALAAADKAVLFKNSVKEIAYRHGIVASFMAKWNNELPGCGGHLHQSLWDSDQKQNMFFDLEQENYISEVMLNYIGGIQHCLPEIMPMFAPTVNSYKRLVEGTWAPTTNSWGIDNRTTAMRVISGDMSSQRLELRLPGSDVNPYLAIAASLAAGLYGIENNIKPITKPITGNAYAAKGQGRLAENLAVATAKMKNSKVANELFGEPFVKHFTLTREWEWKQYSKVVSDWELKRYFEII